MLFFPRCCFAAWRAHLHRFALALSVCIHATDDSATTAAAAVSSLYPFFDPSFSCTRLIGCASPSSSLLYCLIPPLSTHGSTVVLAATAGPAARLAVGYLRVEGATGRKSTAGQLGPHKREREIWRALMRRRARNMHTRHTRAQAPTQSTHYINIHPHTYTLGTHVPSSSSPPPMKRADMLMLATYPACTVATAGSACRRTAAAHSCTHTHTSWSGERNKRQMTTIDGSAGPMRWARADAHTYVQKQRLFSRTRHSHPRTCCSRRRLRPSPAPRRGCRGVAVAAAVAVPAVRLPPAPPVAAIRRAAVRAAVAVNVTAVRIVSAV